MFKQLEDNDEDSRYVLKYIQPVDGANQVLFLVCLRKLTEFDNELVHQEDYCDKSYNKCVAILLGRCVRNGRPKKRKNRVNKTKYEKVDLDYLLNFIKK